MMTLDTLLNTRKQIEQDLEEFTQRLAEATDAKKKTIYRKNITKFQQQLIMNAQMLLQVK
jgi:hypothetical protein